MKLGPPPAQSATFTVASAVRRAVSQFDSVRACVFGVVVACSQTPAPRRSRLVRFVRPSSRRLKSSWFEPAATAMREPLPPRSSVRSFVRSASSAGNVPARLLSFRFSPLTRPFASTVTPCQKLSGGPLAPRRCASKSCPSVNRPAGTPLVQRRS